MTSQKAKLKNDKHNTYYRCFIQTLHKLKPSEHVKQYIVGVLLILTNIAIGVTMKSPKVMIFSAAFIVTAFVWSFAYMYAQQFNSHAEQEVIATNKMLEQKPTSPPKKSTPQSFGGIIIENSSFINNKVGISAPKGANIRMDTNNFEGNEKSIEIRDK